MTVEIESKSVIIIVYARSKNNNDIKPLYLYTLKQWLIVLTLKDFSLMKRHNIASIKL
jgi:hypothetical protein